MLCMCPAARCRPRRRPCRPPQRCGHLLLSLVLLAPAWPGPAQAADEPAVATQQPDQTPPREQLLAARDDLIRRANQAYQDGQHDTALQLLEQLFPLYEQLYPAAEYPNGGVEVARTYQ
ncbi:MAG: hypothetical protein MUF48_12365, partial [Pirellulaceae bacterium]|nr:hypothetical protein [Pirellulaceae bacterium]